MDAAPTYVVIGRARHHAAIDINSREKLADAVELRSGERQTALETARRMESAKPEKPASGRSMVL